MTLQFKDSSTLLFGGDGQLAIDPDCCCNPGGRCGEGLADLIDGLVCVLTVAFDACADQPAQYFPYINESFEFKNCATMSVTDLLLTRNNVSIDPFWQAPNPNGIPPGFFGTPAFRCNDDAIVAMVAIHGVRLRCVTDTTVRIEYLPGTRGLNAGWNPVIASLDVPWATFNPLITYALTPNTGIPCAITNDQILVRWA